MFLDWRILKQCRVDVLPGKIVDYLWDLVRKAAPAPPRKVTSDAMRHRGGPRPMTHLHRGLWPQRQWAGARSVWLLFWILVWVECDMGLMTRVTLVTRLGLSVILMSSVILTNDGCDTPPYTNRNHSHRKPGPFYFQAKVSKSFVGCKNISSHFLGGTYK